MAARKAGKGRLGVFSDVFKQQFTEITGLGTFTQTVKKDIDFPDSRFFKGKNQSHMVSVFRYVSEPALAQLGRISVARHTDGISIKQHLARYRAADASNGFNQLALSITSNAGNTDDFAGANLK